MLWHAMPPELNTARLIAGAGATPMLTAAAGWEALAAALAAQATELASRLNGLGEVWTGASSDRAIAAAMPMVVWLQTVEAQARSRAVRATAQATAYLEALATTPALAEIAENHITHAVLAATNFFGINTVPIAAKESDYVIRMWNQAAGAMDAYQAQTMANTKFEQLQPVAAILNPALTQQITTGIDQLSGIAAQVSALPVGGVPLQQMATETLAMSAPMQSLMQPLWQVSSLFTQLGGAGAGAGALGDGEAAQVGLLDAGPLSNHPLAGGSGPSAGAGLLRADSLPGSGGTLARTPLMSQLLDNTDVQSPLPPADSAAGANGAVPVGAGAMGRAPQSGATAKPGIAAPAIVTDDDETGHPIWGDQDDDW